MIVKFFFFGVQTRKKSYLHNSKIYINNLALPNYVLIHFLSLKLKISQCYSFSFQLAYHLYFYCGLDLKFLDYKKLISRLLEIFWCWFKLLKSWPESFIDILYTHQTHNPGNELHQVELIFLYYYMINNIKKNFTTNSIPKDKIQWKLHIKWWNKKTWYNISNLKNSNPTLWLISS